MAGESGVRQSSHDWRRSSVLAWLALGVGLVRWLWPIGFGGMMPVGGDVTQFSLGLMAVLARSLRSWRIPVWNDLWGYGFPGLAESQMGVYYPPHWVLYGLLPLEWAYTASLVLHTLLGAAGTYWAARRFEVSPAGSALAAFAWSASGFFVIHLPHQWGYTVGSWMPWAWGLAWLVAQGRGGTRVPLLLAAVLAIQVLPGHFQLAFCTEVGVVLLALGGASGSRDAGRGLMGVALALALVVPLAALQLWPTYRLAQLASARRDYEYLSGFAASPVHLVTYLAPELFRGSPLWRPLVWDPFHTSPEEHLAYIGLVPLFLALGTAVHGLRRDAAVRALVVVAVATTLFSLGPYVPGFAVWSRLPGFSFFRAPARWSAASGLALCLLAGRGFDGWRLWPRPGRLLVGFCALTVAAVGLVVGGVELALASTSPPRWPAVARGFQGALNLLPWPRVVQAAANGREGPAVHREPTFEDLAAMARQPQDDLRVEVALARQGFAWQDGRARTFARMRVSIYRLELVVPAVLLASLLIIAALMRWPTAAAVGLVALTAADLWSLGHQRPFDLGPIRPLTEQSRVLAGLVRGERTADQARNLPMVAGAAPISSYRTLDLPCMPELTALALGRVGGQAGGVAVLEALRASGAAVRIFDPFETAEASRSSSRWPAWDAFQVIHDPALAGWLYGADWVKRKGRPAATFTLYRPPPRAAQAWLLPLTADRGPTILESHAVGPATVLEALRQAAPLGLRRPRPEHLEVRVQAPGRAVVLVSQLAHPQWRARWVGPGGEQPATIHPVGARPGDMGWQAVDTPGPGLWTLRLDYDSRDVRVGLGLSGLTWLIWLIAFGRLGGRIASDSQGDPS